VRLPPDLGHDVAELTPSLAWRREIRAELSVRLTAAKRTPERAFLGTVSAVPLQQSLADLKTAYRNFSDSGLLLARRGVKAVVVPQLHAESIFEFMAEYRDIHTGSHRVFVLHAHLVSSPTTGHPVFTSPHPERTADHALPVHTVPGPTSPGRPAMPPSTALRQRIEQQNRPA
jgi:hypothetical protein